MLSESSIRKGWEAERENICKDLLAKKFSPKSIDRVADNFVESMVFAKIPCTTRTGVLAAAKQHERERLIYGPAI